MDIKHSIDLVGIGFEVAGVLVLVFGTLFAGAVYIARALRRERVAYQVLRRDLGKAILIGLELLIAADIVRSVAIDPTFVSVGVLGLIVLIRTFLSWSLEVEINGRWPWQHAQAQEPVPDDTRNH